MNHHLALRPEIVATLRQERLAEAARERRAKEANPIAMHVVLAYRVAAVARRIGLGTTTAARQRTPAPAVPRLA
jgi:hypothetical protein